MKKDNVFSIVTMSCGLLLVIGVFLPYITYYSTSMSLWKMEDPTRVIYILLGLMVIALYLVNKKTELSYLAAGFGTFSAISHIISIEGFDGLSIGFYLILLSSITIGVMTFLYEEKNADALINLSVSVNKPVMNNNQQPINNQMNYNGPVINQPSTNMMESQSVMPNPQPMRFDPNTGERVNPNNN